MYKRFACIFDGHDHTARLNPASNGYWHYDCPALSRGIGLAEVRAFLGYKGDRHISGVEAARWRERLDFEAGLRSPVPLDVILPAGTPVAAQVVAARMRQFVGLRDRRFPLGEPFPFAHDFAQAYCELSADQVRAGKDFLERAGITRRAGRHGRAILWLLAAQDEDGA